MPRNYSTNDIANWKFKTIDLPAEWTAHLGDIPTNFRMLIKGRPKNGKTEYCFQLSRMFAECGRKVSYNSPEQGKSPSFQDAFFRNKMQEIKGKWMLCGKNCREFEPWFKLLERPNSCHVILLDSVDRMNLTREDYIRLDQRFPNKAIIMVCWNNPMSTTAKAIEYFVDIVVDVKDFRATSFSRYVRPIRCSYQTKTRTVMYYRCTRCNAALQSKGRPSVKCSCGARPQRWERAERNRIIEQQDKYADVQVYRSGAGDWILKDGIFVRLVGCLLLMILVSCAVLDRSVRVPRYFYQYADRQGDLHYFADPVPYNIGDTIMIIPSNEVRVIRDFRLSHDVMRMLALSPEEFNRYFIDRLQDHDKSKADSCHQHVVYSRQ